MEDFLKALEERFDLEALLADPSPILAIDEALAVRWTNRTLKGVEVGASVVAGFDGELREFYADTYRRWMEAERPVDHDYECHTPTRFRVFRLRAFPVDGRGLLLVHSIVVDRPMDLPEEAPGQAYRDEHGVVHLCGHCRRTRRNATQERWDWVPAYLEPDVPKRSHGICSTCADYYFGPP